LEGYKVGRKRCKLRRERNKEGMEGNRKVKKFDLGVKEKEGEKRE